VPEISQYVEGNDVLSAVEGKKSHEDLSRPASEKIKGATSSKGVTRVQKARDRGTLNFPQMSRVARGRLKLCQRQRGKQATGVLSEGQKVFERRETG